MRRPVIVPAIVHGKGLRMQAQASRKVILDTAIAFNQLNQVSAVMSE